MTDVPPEELVEVADRLDVEPVRWLDGLHRLKGLGKEIWAGVDADKYVAELRERWDQ